MMSITTRRFQRTLRTVGPLRPIAHGSELLVSDVGPWALQGVAKGSESLETIAGPTRGYWRFDTPDEFLPNTPWPSNADDNNPSVLNDPNLHGGIVTDAPVVIDGYTLPVGTRIVQFRDFPNEYDFYAQGTSLEVLFRGCRFRWPIGVGGAGIFNDNASPSSQHILMHFCDLGLLSRDPDPGSEGLMHIKFLGGSNHRLLRNYHTLSNTFVQPNTSGVVIVENYIDDFLFTYGEAGPSGNFSDPGHLNGISTEGNMTSITISRNHIVAPSPDGALGATGFTAGEIGYGTQLGQVGYGNGSNPGRLLLQTDCIGLFTTSGDNPGTGGLVVTDNYVGGTGWCIYAGGANAHNVTLTGNTFTTRWWTNAGGFGAIADTPVWGSNGNIQSGNVWADDYGTGGNGCTAIGDRQYPSGDGPRVGASVV